MIFRLLCRSMLLVGVAFAGVVGVSWERAFHWRCILRYTSDRRSAEFLFLDVAQGQVRLTVFDGDHRGAGAVSRKWLGMSFEQSGSSSFRLTQLTLPAWVNFSLAAVIGAAPMVVSRPLRRWRRRRRGLCLACGYDLRGNASGRCPECGSERAP